jgi:hypothetical protein
MPKVHFHIREGDVLIRDEEGAEFGDLADAKHEAEASLHDMLAEDIKNARPVQHRVIEMTDEAGKILATVEMRAAVKMVQETRTD